MSICGCGHGHNPPACFLAVPLSRSRSFAISMRFALRVVLLDCPVGPVPSSLRRASPPRSTCLKRFNRCGFLSNHPSVACGDVMPFNPIGFILSLLARSAIFLVGLFLACGRVMRYRGSSSRLPYRLAARPVSRSYVPPLCPPGGEGRSVCGELDETARVPMMGWCRFSFSRHLVFDTG